MAGVPSTLDSFDVPITTRTTGTAVARHLVWRRAIARAARWLHIYGSMISLAVVLFFSATGLMLDHPQWFEGHEQSLDRAGTLNTAWLKGDSAGIDRLGIVEFFRTTYGITGAVSDFRVEGPDVSVAFRGPGYSADALIERATGQYTLRETRLGVAAILGDLHKGRDTGDAWKVVIDASAALLCFVSFTGLVLLYFLQKHRTAGVILALFGGLAAYLGYVLIVP